MTHRFIRYGTGSERYQVVRRRIETLVGDGKMGRNQADTLLGYRVLTAEELTTIIHEHCETVDQACTAFAGLAPYVLDGYEVGAAEEIADLAETWEPSLAKATTTQTVMG